MNRIAKITSKLIVSCYIYSSSSLRMACIHIIYWRQALARQDDKTPKNELTKGDWKNIINLLEGETGWYRWWDDNRDETDLCFKKKKKKTKLNKKQTTKKTNTTRREGKSKTNSIKLSRFNKKRSAPRRFAVALNFQCARLPNVVVNPNKHKLRLTI